MRLSILKKIFDIADNVSTRPNRTSWIWKGKVSILALIFLHIVYISRLCSILQWCKYIFRCIKKKREKSFSTDKASKRINIPPCFVELYFIIWGIAMFTIPTDFKAIHWFSYYFLFESFFWLLYYFFFRRFFEEKYAIMHLLEYIVILPIIIVTQTKCIAILLDISFGDALATLFFPTKQDNIYLVISSVLYTALIFGIFITNLPVERVKEKGGYRYNISFIGNGNIVKERLLPTLSDSNIKREVAIFDINEPKEPTETKKNVKIKYFQIDENSSKDVLASNIVWIATPPATHLHYLSKYLNTSFIVVEKPLTTRKNEFLTFFRLRHSDMWKHVFCLSYYYLEKALPLTYPTYPGGAPIKRVTAKRS